MSREIKFRAFDPLDKKMMGPWDWDDILRGEMTIHPSGDECDVMQFTGLHDKNGVDIYEGDVLAARYQPQQTNAYGNFKARDYAVRMQVVFTETAAFRGRNIQPKSAKNSRNWTTKSLADEGLDQIEVIGNIYQNPELLETK